MAGQPVVPVFFLSDSTGIRGGRAIVDRMKSVHTAASARGMAHPAIKADTMDGAEADRRR